MKFVSVNEIKEHLRLDDIQAEDAYIESIGNAAEGLALSKINRSAEDVEGLGDTFFSQFKVLVWELAGSLYRVREADTDKPLAVTPIADALCKSLRKL